METIRQKAVKITDIENDKYISELKNKTLA
jgi:hypothetical protein